MLFSTRLSFLALLRCAACQSCTDDETLLFQVTAEIKTHLHDDVLLPLVDEVAEQQSGRATAQVAAQEYNSQSTEEETAELGSSDFHLLQTETDDEQSPDHPDYSEPQPQGFMGKGRFTKGLHQTSKKRVRRNGKTSSDHRVSRGPFNNPDYPPGYRREIRAIASGGNFGRFNSITFAQCIAQCDSEDECRAYWWSNGDQRSVGTREPIGQEAGTCNLLADQGLEEPYLSVFAKYAESLLQTETDEQPPGPLLQTSEKRVRQNGKRGRRSHPGVPTPPPPPPWSSGYRRQCGRTASGASLDRYNSITIVDCAGRCNDDDACRAFWWSDGEPRTQFHTENTGNVYATDGKEEGYTRYLVGICNLLADASLGIMYDSVYMKQPASPDPPPTPTPTPGSRRGGPRAGSAASRGKRGPSRRGGPRAGSAAASRGKRGWMGGR